MRSTTQRKMPRPLAGKLVDWAAVQLGCVLQIVRRSDDMAGFVVLPRRWIVERTLFRSSSAAAASAIGPFAG